MGCQFICSLPPFHRVIGEVVKCESREQYGSFENIFRNCSINNQVVYCYLFDNVDLGFLWENNFQYLNVSCKEILHGNSEIFLSYKIYITKIYIFTAEEKIFDNFSFFLTDSLKTETSVTGTLMIEIKKFEKSFIRYINYFNGQLRKGNEVCQKLSFGSLGSFTEQPTNWSKNYSFAHLMTPYLSDCCTA